jgi:hypothetical protein
MTDLALPAATSAGHPPGWPSLATADSRLSLACAAGLLQPYTAAWLEQ